MKKILLLSLSVCLTKLIQAQSWTQALNIISGTPPNFGTKSNDPINFYTNNTQWMTLGTGGDLAINNLIGTGDRFLKVNASGVLQPWTGSIDNASKVLFGDGSWKVPAFSQNGSNINSATGSKVKIGTGTPAADLDVTGNAILSRYLGLTGISLGSSSDYAPITYQPATSTVPGIVCIGCRPLAPGTYPDQGTSGTTTFLNTSNDFCSGGGGRAMLIANIATQHAGDLFLGQSSRGNLRMGHDGTAAYLEVQGINSSSPSALAPLVINSCGTRGVYIFGGETTFLPNKRNIMSVDGRMNLTGKIQVGVSLTSASAFVDSSQIYVYGNAANSGGVKVRQDFGDYGLRVIRKSNSEDEALGVFYTTDNTDGLETFEVEANGQTNINTLSTNALVITNANNSNASAYLIKANGQTFVGPSLQTGTGSMFTVGQSSKTSLAFNLTDNTSATNNKNFFQVYGNAQTAIGSNLQSNSAILTVGQSSKTDPAILLTDNTSAVNKDFFKVYGGAQTFIGTDLQANSSMVTIGQASKYDPAFTITDNTFSTANRDYFKVYGNGYTEINMYSSTNLASDRIMAIKDATNLSSIRDLFVVKKDGKVYAREVEVSSAQPFPDYVFSKDYKLRSLDELESYIAKNAHLPGFEKGEYYEKNGMNVNTMLIKQQEKIEELSLYIIELGKQINELKKTK